MLKNSSKDKAMPSTASFLFRRGLLVCYALFGGYAVRHFTTYEWASTTIVSQMHAKAKAFSKLYSKDDLYMQMFGAVPLYFTDMISVLYKKKLPVELIVWMMFVVLKIVLPLSIWYMLYVLIGSPFIAAIATVFTLYLSNMLTGFLHHTFIYPVAAHYGFFPLPLVFLAVGFMLNGWLLAGTVLSCLVIYLYAPIATALAACLAATMLTSGASFDEIASNIAIFSALMAPFIIKHINPTNTDKVINSNVTYAALKEWSYHFFIEKHLYQGYGFFALMLYGCVLLGPFYRDFLPNKGAVSAMIIGLILVLVLYLVNLYTFKNITFINSHSSRVTMLLKPICFGLITFGMLNLLTGAWLSESPVVVQVVALTGILLIILSLNLNIHFVHPDGLQNLLKAELFALFGWGLLSLSILGWRSFLTGVATIVPVSLSLGLVLIWLLSRQAGKELVRYEYLLVKGEGGIMDKLYFVNAFNLFLGVAGSILLWSMDGTPYYSIAITPPSLIDASRMMWTMIIVLLVAFLQYAFRIGIIHFARFGLPGYLTAKVMETFSLHCSRTTEPTIYNSFFLWARFRAKPRSVFVFDPNIYSLLPPVFRYFAEKSVWVWIWEVKGIVYDNKLFTEGRKRYYELGANLEQSPFVQFKDDSSGFYEKDSKWWMKYASVNPIDYIVFEKSRIKQQLSLRVAYQDDTYIVYEVR